MDVSLKKYVLQDIKEQSPAVSSMETDSARISSTICIFNTKWESQHRIFYCYVLKNKMALILAPRPDHGHPFARGWVGLFAGWQWWELSKQMEANGRIMQKVVEEGMDHLMNAEDTVTMLWRKEELSD